MDKRLIENARVRKSIEEALFKLMNEKKFSEITVSDIIHIAGVARASYYRNYNSKEQVIESFIIRIHNDAEYFGKHINTLEDVANLETITESLTYYLQYKYYILQLYDNGFGSLVLEMYNQFVEEALGDMPQHSTQKYKLYFLTGSAFNIMIQWLKNGAVESPYEMAQAFLTFWNGGNQS